MNPTTHLHTGCSVHDPHGVRHPTEASETLESGPHRLDDLRCLFLAAGDYREAESGPGAAAPVRKPQTVTNDAVSKVPCLQGARIRAAAE